MNLKLQKDEIFSRKLVKWWEKNRRLFPWREKERTSFQILLAEHFLKRTTSSHVIKIYSTFILKYGDFDDILNADIYQLEEELKTLGLQKQRVSQLKKMSKFILDNYKGKVPKNEKKLIKIPGIGQYSSRAILCFAFNIRSYPIDSNVQRVITRVFFNEDWKKVKISKVEQIFKLIQPKKNFSLFNYSLLDFGSILCRPSYPKCDICPVPEICNYHKRKYKSHSHS